MTSANFSIRKPYTVSVNFTPEQAELHEKILNVIHEILSMVHCTDNTVFMMTTIRRQAASCLFGLIPTLQSILCRHILEIVDDEDEAVNMNALAEDRSIIAIQGKINDILSMAEALPPDDPKFDALMEIVQKKCRDVRKNKIMIFSSFKHTLRYLNRRLSECGYRVGMIHGEVPDEERRTLRGRFDPSETPSSALDAIDILLFSEVGCEGLDYQFCDCMINYDLPSRDLSVALEEGMDGVLFKIELYQEQKQRAIARLEEQLLALSSKQAQTQEKLQAAEAKEREKREKHKRDLTEKITAMSHTLKDTFEESISRVDSRINQHQARQRQEIMRLESQLEALRDERSRVQAKIQQLEAEEQEKRNQQKPILMELTSDLLQNLADAVRDSLSSAKSKIESYQSQGQRDISAMEAQLDSLRAEQARVQGRFLPFGRKARLNELAVEISALQDRLEQVRAKQVEEASLFVSPEANSDHEVILAWLSKVSDIIPEVGEERLRCTSLRDQLNQLSDELKSMDAPIVIDDGSNERLFELETEMGTVQDDLNWNKTRQAEDARIFLAPAKDADDDEILAWLLSVSNIIPDVEEDIRRWTDVRDEFNSLSQQLTDLDGPIEIKDGSRAKLAKFEADRRAVQDELDQEKASLEKNAPVLAAPVEGTGDSETIDWFSSVMAIIPEVREEALRCTKLRDEFSQATNELSTMDARIDVAKEHLDAQQSAVYPDAVKKMSTHLCKAAEKYTLTQTYQLVFDRAALRYRTKNGIGRITGKYHRYDLYAMLLFAMKFFGHTVGTSRFLCVDEGQDLALNEYRLLYEINGRNVVFNIFGDTNQLMKPGRGISDWTVLQNAFGARVFTLNENYRNTNQITRFCNSSFDMNVTQTGVDGANVREISRRDLEKELAKLNIGNERLAILVPRSVQKKQYLHRELLPPAIAKAIGDKMENGCIALMYVDEVKGIEFDKAFVVCSVMSRSEKYIAYTRALSELILVIGEEKPDML